MKVFLQNIRSCHNVGAIFRTADAVGCEQVFLGGYTPLPENKWKEANKPIAKVSLGAEKSLPWKKVHHLGKQIQQLKAQGHILIALELANNAVDYNQIIIPKQDFSKVVLFLGNERRGISKPILAKMDHIIKIPMQGIKESLNVSVAFGIAVFMLRDNPLINI